jgi:prephenate dehydrogenase
MDQPGIAPERVLAVAALPDRIALLGLGLIGGSIALGLREAGYRGRIAAWTPAGRGPSEAGRRGIVVDAAASAADAIHDAGLVILAGPPLAIIGSIGDLAGPLRSALAGGATITDVGSTKTRIVAAADVAQLAFVGGHPMAGRETTGIAAATGDLFVDRPWVVMPADAASPVDIGRVEALATALGARSIRMTPDAHDDAVAAISHLPMVLAASLVETVTSGGGEESWPLARELAATGWRDMTRLARGDAAMGADILVTNTAAVTNRLRGLRRVIDSWITQLEDAGPDPAALREKLEAARAALIAGREGAGQE